MFRRMSAGRHCDGCDGCDRRPSYDAADRALARALAVALWLVLLGSVVAGVLSLI